MNSFQITAEYFWGTDYSRMSDEDINTKIYTIVSDEHIMPDEYDLASELIDLLDKRISSINFDEASYDAYRQALLDEEIEELDYYMAWCLEDTKYYDL